MKKGDIVLAAANKDPLHCGSSVYPFAICVSVDPFVLVSSSGDMLWSNKDPNSVYSLHCRVHPDDAKAAFARYEKEVALKTTTDKKEKVLQFLKEHLKASSLELFGDIKLVGEDTWQAAVSITPKGPLLTMEFVLSDLDLVDYPSKAVKDESISSEFSVGEIIRYGAGPSGLAKLISAHAGGWKAEHCLGGIIFVSDTGRTLFKATKDDEEEYFKYKNKTDRENTQRLARNVLYIPSFSSISSLSTDELFLVRWTNFEGKDQSKIFSTKDIGKMHDKLNELKLLSDKLSKAAGISFTV